MKNHSLLLLAALTPAFAALSMHQSAQAAPAQLKIIKQLKQATSDKVAKITKPAKPVVPIIRDKWAVLIGVSRYNDSAVGTVKYATSNVLKLAKVLVDPNVGRFAPDHVLVVTQDKANKNNLARAVYEDWLIKKALPNDLIVLYICMKAAPSDLQNDLLLFGADGVLADKEKSASSLAGMLGELKRRTQSKNIVCLLDTSMVSGIAEKYPRGFSEMLKKIGADTQTTILAADDNLLQSQDSKMGSSSSFIEYLTEGLKAGAGALPIETVAGFINESMAKQEPPAPPLGDLKAGTAALLHLPQRPSLLLNPTNLELGKVPFGMPIKNNSFNAANVHVGHSIEKLEETNPALAKAARDMQEQADPTDPQSKIDQLLSKQGSDATSQVSGKMASKANENKALAQSQDDDDDDQDGSNVDFGPYMSNMKKTIQSKWASPKGFEKKKVIVVFSILRDGKITEAELVESSGSAETDKTAMQALKDASPLPPLPKGAPKHVQIRYQFDYKVN